MKFLSSSILSLWVPQFYIDADYEDSAFQKIRSLLIDITPENSKELSEIYEENKEKICNSLKEQKEDLTNQIIGSKNKEIIDIQSSDNPNKEMIIAKIIDGCFKTKVNKELVGKINLIDSIYSEYQLISKAFSIDGINSQLLELNKQFIDHLAYVIFDPSMLVIDFLKLDDAWDQFPLKWYFYRKDIRETRLTFDYYKQEGTLDEYILCKYDSGDFEEIINSVNDSFIHKAIHDRRSIILESIENFKDGRYASVICLLLPIIEGLIWEYAKMIDTSEDSIFEDKQDFHLKKCDGTVFKSTKVRELLQDTNLRKCFDETFMGYFCN